MTAPADPSWWHDWIKFLPGWLAFAWAFGTGTWQGVRKWRNRLNKVALGPADNELRDALTIARTRFEDILAEGRRSDWFTAEERGETGRRITDLAGRRTDRALRDELAGVAKAWDAAFAHAPAPAGPRVRWSDEAITDKERAETARVQALFGKEADEARKGLEHIKAALTRLDELERRTHGR